jgi:uncharacterized membrane protein YkvI
MVAMTGARPSWFQRFLLPGFAFKAVVIGGGYATGRELAEFFLPSGPWGGLAGMLLATAIWSGVSVVTFLYARSVRALDYHTFFKHLLGPFAVVFEMSYVVNVVLILAVFGAAAGELGDAIFQWPKLYGTLCLAVGIGLFTMFGNTAVERLFKWVSIFLYVTYGLFLLLALTKFGDKVPASFSSAAPTDGWVLAGVTYSAYNIIGAVAILPVVRHMTSSADAVKAGLLAGPLAMLPAIIFFVCMCAFYPQIKSETLPSDFMLRQMGLPLFHVVFQLMIFAALLECGTGSVHAINERVASAYRRRHGSELPRSARLLMAAAVLIGSMFLANLFGLVTLIARGYRALAYVILVSYVIPVLTYGIWSLCKERRVAATERAHAAYGPHRTG